MILDQYGNPVNSSGNQGFSGATLRNDRSVPPQRIWRDDFEKLVPDVDRQFIVSGSRKLFQNFGPWSTPMVQKADNAIGRAWGPKFCGSDKVWGAEVVDWLANQWYGNCDVRGRSWDFKTLLWVDSVAVDRDGDFLIYLTEGEGGYPLTQRISCNRIGQRIGQSYAGNSAMGMSAFSLVQDGLYKGARISHGVIRNNLNRPIAYRILGDTQADDKDIPANDCIHVFDPQWHDQVRGIPSGQAAIKMIYGSLTATEREQLNQNMRSSYAFVEYNDTGGPDLLDPSVTAGKDATGNDLAKPTYESLAGGMIKYFRSNSGGKIESIANDMPGNMWSDFQDRVIRTHAAAINWPYELYWKSGEVNAALVRNIQERARMSVEDRQDTIKSPALFQIRYAIAKAIKSGILPKPKDTSDWWKFDFNMPRKFSIDPGKEANQRREDYRIGLRNRTDIILEEGRGDVALVDDERITEVFDREEKIAAEEKRRGIKIDRRLFYMLTPNEMMATETEEVPLDENGNPIDQTKQPA